VVCVCGFTRSDQWWCHQPEFVLDNSSNKVLYNFNCFIDYGIATRWPDLVLFNCVMDVMWLINKDVKIELQSLWGIKVAIGFWYSGFPT